MSKMEIIKRSAKKTNNSSENLKKAAWVAILESAIMIIMGVFLIAWPNVVIKTIAYVIGTFFLVKGLFQVINYLSTNGYNNFFNNELLWGAICIVIGIAIMIAGEKIESVFRIVVGIWIVYEALTRINTAIKMTAAKINNSRIVLILAIVMLVFGLYVTFCDGAVIVLIGWIMLLSGVVGLFDDIVLMQNVGKILKKVTKVVDGVVDGEEA